MIRAMHDMMGSQEVELLNEIHAVRLEISRLDGRFDKVRRRFTESVEREVLLTQRLTQAVKNEQEQAAALQAAKTQYKALASELESTLASQRQAEERQERSLEVEGKIQQALGVVQAEIDELAPLRGGHSELLEQIKLYGSMEEATGRRLVESDQRTADLQRRLRESKEAIVGLASELESAVELEPELREQLRGALERGRALAGELSESRQRRDSLESLLKNTVDRLESGARLESALTEKLDAQMAQATRLAAELAAVREREAGLAGDLCRSHEQEKKLIERLESVGRELAGRG